MGIYSLEELINIVEGLRTRVADLEEMLAPEAQKKNTLSVLKDVLSDQLQAMEDDEFVSDEDDEVEEIK